MNLSEVVARDKELSSRLSQQVDHRLKHALAWTIARTGDSWLWILAIALLLWRRSQLGWQLLSTVAITALLVFAAKSIFRRQRPSESRLAISADKYAFPSGHAARAAAVAVTLAAANPQLLIFWLLWAAAVSVARVALSRHFLTDVAGGLALGFVVGFSLQFIY